jgi:hypothetical protein
MPEFVRTVISQLHAFLGTSKHINKRVMSLPLTISLPSSNEERNEVSQPACDGYTYDFSRKGLSFIVRTLRIGNEHMFYDVNSKLRIKVGLPNGLVEMYIVPVRFDRWDESESGTKYIVGARIVEASVSNHARYIEFLSKNQAEFVRVNSVVSNASSAVSTQTI